MGTVLAYETTGIEPLLCAEVTLRSPRCHSGFEEL